MIDWIYFKNIYNIIPENNCSEIDLLSQPQSILATF